MDLDLDCVVTEPLTTEPDARPELLAEMLRLIRDMIEVLILFPSLKSFIYNMLRDVL